MGSTTFFLAVSATVAAVVRSQLISSTGYVPSRSLAEVAAGDIQLKQAWEAAYVQALSDGTWGSIVGADPALLRTEACLPNPALMPFPQNPIGSLFDVLQKGVLTTGFVAPPAGSIYTPAGMLWMDSNGAGMASAYYRAVVTRMGTAYQRSYLGLNMVKFANGDAVLQALYAGSVDVLLGFTTPIDVYGGLNRGYVAKQVRDGFPIVQGLTCGKYLDCQLCRCLVLVERSSLAFPRCSANASSLSSAARSTCSTTAAW